MSEHWWRRKRRFNPFFDSFFDDGDKIERMLDDMIRQAFGSSVEREKARKRYVYYFGDTIPRYAGDSQVHKEYEPLLDMYVDDANVTVVAELHGVDKDYIQIRTTEDKLTISVNTPKRGYFKELSLPAKVDLKSWTSSLKNGVLEIRLKKLLDERLLAK